MSFVFASRSFAPLAGVLAIAGSAFAQAPATTAPGQPNQAPDPAAAPAQTPAGTTNTLAVGPLTITGAIEANYTLNFNQPYDGSNNYLYNVREGQLALNLADLRIAKQATPESRLGFLVRPIAGEVARYNFTAADGNGTNNFQILEAYGTYLVPFNNRDLKVDVGQFVTHVGYETIEVGTNNFFSRNFLFIYPSPFYNAGIRASYPLSTRTTVTGFILNRYNGVADSGNRDLAPGFQVVQTLGETQTLVLNGLYSRENIGTTFNPGYPGAGTVTNGNNFANSNNKNTGIIDLIYSNQISPRIKIVGEGLYRYGKTGNNKNQNIFGAAGYLIYGFTNGNVAAIRGEYLSDSRRPSQVAAAGTPAIGLPAPYVDPSTNDARPSLASITGSYELRAGIFPGLRTLFEARYDISNYRIFSPKNATDNGKKNQFTLTAAQIFNF
jgi:hypothetical protein